MKTTSQTSRRQRHPGALLAKALGLAACLAVLPAGPANADPPDPAFTVHLEPAVALWVDQPQSDRFTPGFYGAFRVERALGSVVGLQLSYAGLAVPAGQEYSDFGVAHFALGGVRVRPFAMQQPEDRSGGLFMDFNLGYVLTGPLNRFGFDAGLGYGFQLSPGFSLGPVARYVHIVQPDKLRARDANDGQFVTLGLDFAFGVGGKEAVAEPEPEPEPEPVAEPEPVEPKPKVVTVITPCPDRDGDGVCNEYDRCPLKIGPVATFGCPPDPCTGDPLVVAVQFEQDSSELPPVVVSGKPQTMVPVLDAVADAIEQDPSCRVCVIGHASEEGSMQYNQDLSMRRAHAVSEYLTEHGIDTPRVPHTAFGESCPLVPDSTLPLNRRVEFLRLGEGESCPTECVE